MKGFTCFKFGRLEVIFMGIEILKEYEFFQEQIKETQLRVMHVHKGNVLLPLNFEIQWWIFERFILLSS